MAREATALGRRIPQEVARGALAGLRRLHLRHDSARSELEAVDRGPRLQQLGSEAVEPVDAARLPQDGGQDLRSGEGGVQLVFEPACEVRRDVAGGPPHRLGPPLLHETDQCPAHGEGDERHDPGQAKGPAAARAGQGRNGVSLGKRAQYTGFAANRMQAPRPWPLQGGSPCRGGLGGDSGDVRGLERCRQRGRAALQRTD